MNGLILVVVKIGKAVQTLLEEVSNPTERERERVVKVSHTGLMDGSFVSG